MVALSYLCLCRTSSIWLVIRSTSSYLQLLHLCLLYHHHHLHHHCEETLSQQMPQSYGTYNLSSSPHPPLPQCSSVISPLRHRHFWDIEVLRCPELICDDYILIINLKASGITEETMNKWEELSFMFNRLIEMGRPTLKEGAISLGFGPELYNRKNTYYALLPVFRENTTSYFQSLVDLTLPLWGTIP